MKILCLTVCLTDAAEVAEEEAPLLAGVRLLALDMHDDVRVWEECPAFVIMYDPDIAFIRQLEVRRRLDRTTHIFFHLSQSDC